MKFDRKEYESFFFETAKELIYTPSPSGYYTEIMPLLEKIAVSVGCDFEMTRKGCAILTYKGKNSEKAIGACAHVDTLGAMVRSINSEGEIMFTPVGSPALPTLDGEYCTVITRDAKKYTGTFLSKSPAVHVFKDASTKERTADTMYVRLDEAVESKEEVLALGIENGCYIAIDPKTTVTESGYLKSRFIDDKGGVASLLTACKIMHDKGVVPDFDIKILITVFEEVGHGAAFVPENLCSMVGVDMGCIGEDLSCTERDVSICAKDSRGPYDYELTCRLVSMAKEEKLSYAVDIYPFYGSDIGAMWSAGHDVPGALIGSGVHASHGMERTHIDGIMNTVSLILLYFGV